MILVTCIHVATLLAPGVLDGARHFQMAIVKRRELAKLMRIGHAAVECGRRSWAERSCVFGH